MNLAIALSAARYGAAVANYTEVVRLLKATDPQGGEEKVCGARCRDVLTGEAAGAASSSSNRGRALFLSALTPPPPHRAGVRREGQVCDQRHGAVHRLPEEDGLPGNPKYLPAQRRRAHRHPRLLQVSSTPGPLPVLSLVQ